MTKCTALLCIGLTTIDVVALPVQIQPFDGVRLLSALQMAPAVPPAMLPCAVA